MIKFCFIFLLLFIPGVGFAQTKSIPAWFINSFKNNKLSIKYQLDAYAKPAFLKADFNGDGIKDIAALIIERKTRKKGIVIMHGTTNPYFVFGAGVQFGNGGDNFKWMTGWKLYTKKVAYETQVNKNGDLIDPKKVKMKRSAVYVYKTEDLYPNSGGLIYWDGKKYIWIQQGE